MKSKYPALMALVAIMAAVAKDLTAQGETLIQKLSGSIAIVPQALAFLPLAPGLSAELTELKSNPADEVSCVEELIADFGFSNPKAIEIISSASELAEKLVGVIPSIEKLATAIKA